MTRHERTMLLRACLNRSPIRMIYALYSLPLPDNRRGSTEKVNRAGCLPLAQ